MEFPTLAADDPEDVDWDYMSGELGDDHPLRTVQEDDIDVDDWSYQLSLQDKPPGPQTNAFGRWLDPLVDWALLTFTPQNSGDWTIELRSEMPKPTHEAADDPGDSGHGDFMGGEPEPTQINEPRTVADPYPVTDDVPNEVIWNYDRPFTRRFIGTGTDEAAFGISIMTLLTLLSML